MNKYKFLGMLFHFIYRALSGTTKKEYYYEIENFDMNSQNIVVFWHRKIFTVCNATRIIKKKASMVSASKDGEILSELLRREGNALIRGSSNRDNIKRLVNPKDPLVWMNELEDGYTLGIAIDGPKGPIFEPKAGAIYIAQKTGLPIVPVSSYCNKKWIFEKIWDRLEIPKPFSKNIHFVGKPFYIDKKMSLEEATEMVKKNIHDAGMKAYEIYKEKYLEK